MMGGWFGSLVANALLGMSFTVATVNASDMDLGREGSVDRKAGVSSGTAATKPTIAFLILSPGYRVTSHICVSAIQGSSNDSYKSRISFGKTWLSVQAAKKSATTFIYHSLSSQWAKWEDSAN